LKKRSGCVWIGAGAILALLAGVMAFYAIMRGASSQVAAPAPESPKVKVVVASRAMGARELIQSGDVETRSAPVDIVPESALRSTDEAVGWLTVAPLAPGQMVLSTQLISPTIKGNSAAFAMDKTKVAMAFPADDLMSRNNLLQAGDRVDLLFSLAVQSPDGTKGELTTFSALQNLEIAALVRSSDLESQAKAQAGVTGAQPLAIVFALTPQDALVLKYLKDMGGTVDIVLRAPDAKEQFAVQPIQMSYLTDRYQLRIPIAP
jgi:pilus assembly protein CpaB